MIQVQILCIGKTNEEWVKVGIEKYLKLLSKYVKIELKELPDVKNANKLSPEKLKAEEASMLQQYITEKALLVFLDEHGDTFNSVEWSKWLTKKSLDHSKWVFIIGGSYGIDAELLKKGSSVALSAMTFNHQMVRAILLEQLFRAMTIQAGTSYHH